eukprot:3816119-Prymnesium_polylepis.1
MSVDPRRPHCARRSGARTRGSRGWHVVGTHERVTKCSAQTIGAPCGKARAEGRAEVVCYQQGCSRSGRRAKRRGWRGGIGGGCKV